MFKKNSIKLRGEIDTSVKPTEVRIESISNDVWKDFGYWLEAFTLVAHMAGKEQGWSKEQTVEYITKYLHESLDEIKQKS